MGRIFVNISILVGKYLFVEFQFLYEHEKGLNKQLLATFYPLMTAMLVEVSGRGSLSQ